MTRRWLTGDRSATLEAERLPEHGSALPPDDLTAGMHGGEPASVVASPRAGGDPALAAAAPEDPHAPRYVAGDAPKRSHRGRIVLVVAVMLVMGLTGVVLSSHFSDDGRKDRFFITADEFARKDAPSLGETDGRKWIEVAGSFGIRDGQAVVDEANAAGPRTVAVTDVSTTNGTLTVQAGALVPGWGMVFRYVGPFNYWYLQAVPKYAVFNVVKVVDGKTTVVGRTRLTKLQDGLTVEVRLEDTAIEVRVDGKPIYATTSQHGLGASSAGLMAIGDDAAKATWERLEFHPDRNNPGPVHARTDGVPTTVAGKRTTPTSTPGAGASPSTATSEPAP